MENGKTLKSAKILQFFVAAATVLVTFVNFLAATGRINNTTPGMISDKYPTLLTPAGFAFAIWSVIYAGLVAFSIYQMLPRQTESERIKAVRPLYILSCAANCVWLYFWHHEWILASLSAIFVLLASLILINSKLKNADSKSEYWLARVPFGVYFGWVSIATILNVTIALVYLGFELTGALTAISACALIAAATVLSCAIRFRFALAAYSLTVAWALTAIAVNQADKKFIVVSAAAGAIVSMLVSFIRKKDSYR